MAYSHPLTGHPDAPALRKQAGAYVKQLREAAGLTQQQVSKALGLEYYTMISQIEIGKTRVPPDHIAKLAELLEVDPKEFAKRLLSYYDPFMWQILFGVEAKAKSSPSRPAKP